MYTFYQGLFVDVLNVIDPPFAVARWLLYVCIVILVYFMMYHNGLLFRGEFLKEQGELLPFVSIVQVEVKMWIQQQWLLYIRPLP